MTHRQLPGKVPIMLVERRRLSRKLKHGQLPGKVLPIIIVVQRRLSRKMTYTQFSGKVQSSLLSRGG